PAPRVPEPTVPEPTVPEPTVPEPKAAEPTVPDTAAGSDGDDPLAVVVRHWPGVLELLKEGSRRHHAMIEPAIPVSASRGILTLRYGRRHASFHAVQARTGELDRALRDALQQACGMKFRIDVSIEGEDDRRRPLPPSVTPDDARTPVLDDDPVRAPQLADTPGSDAPSADAPPSGADVDEDEGSEVREAEASAVAPSLDVDALLASELDARLVEEHPPPDAPR
ncbi:MAG: hypothetical protein WD670_05540, partial [Actinomycetota bacterium]